MNDLQKLAIRVRLCLVKRFGQRVEWNGPTVFGVGYKLGNTIYFDTASGQSTAE